MRHKAGRIVAVLLVLLIIVGGGAVAAIYQKNSLAHVYFHKLTDKTEKTTPVATTDKTSSSTIDETKLKAQLKQLQFVGNVAVIQDGKLVYQQPYGQDPQKNTKTATTKYQIGALQNTLTAAAVMQLVKDGKLDLTTPVSKYYLLDNSPWERGSNEYFNRRLRWFFPKKTNFSQVTTDEILAALELINQRPLKIHHQQTAIERFRACSD